MAARYPGRSLLYLKEMEPGKVTAWRHQLRLEGYSKMQAQDSSKYQQLAELSMLR